MLGRAPRHLGDEQRAGRGRGKSLGVRVRHRRKVDQPVFQANGRSPAKCRQTSGPAEVNRSARRAGRGRRRWPAAARGLSVLVAIGQAERLDLGPDVVDLQHRRLRAAAGARSCPPGGGARSARPWPAAVSALFTVMREQPIARHQVVLERDAVAGRPVARQDLALDVGEDARCRAAWPALRLPVMRNSPASRRHRAAESARRTALGPGAGRPRPASCRRTQTQSTVAPCREDPAVEQRVAGRGRQAPGAACRARRDRPARPGDAAGRGAEGVRAAGQRRIEQRPAGRAARLPPARCGRGGARRCEYSSWRSSSRRGRSARWNRSRCRSGRRPPMKRRRVKDAVAEIGLGDRAEPGDRAGCAPGRRSPPRSCGWRGSGTSARRPPRWSSSHSTGRAPDQARQSSTSFTCSATWMWIGPSGASGGHRREFVRGRRRAGCAARRRPRRRCKPATALAALRNRRGEAVEIVDEAPLARRSAARRRSRHGRRTPAAGSGRCRSSAAAAAMRSAISARSA